MSVPLGAPSWAEYAIGAFVGTQRKIRGDIRRARGDAKGRDEHLDERMSWDQEIESAIAEQLVSRWLNRYWSGAVFDPRDPKPDVGRDIEVRWTHHVNGYLLLWPDDLPKGDRRYLLVVGYAPEMVLVGWQTGAFCMEGGWGPQGTHWKPRDPDAKPRRLKDGFWIDQLLLLEPEVLL